jgi:GNAT superfamily N-acetyltransferase
MKISPPDIESLPALCSLLSQQLAEHHIKVPDPDLKKAISRVLDDEKLGFLLVARIVSEVVGVAYVSLNWSLEHGGRSAWLEELYVMPEWRNQGIGEKLLLKVVQQASDLGCMAIDVEVDKTHARAENLYRRAGFLPLSRARWVISLTEKT